MFDQKSTGVERRAFLEALLFDEEENEARLLFAFVFLCVHACVYVHACVHERNMSILLTVLVLKAQRCIAL